MFPRRGMLFFLGTEAWGANVKCTWSHLARYFIAGFASTLIAKTPEQKVASEADNALVTVFETSIIHSDLNVVCVYWGVSQCVPGKLFWKVRSVTETMKWNSRMNFWWMKFKSFLTSIVDWNWISFHSFSQTIARSSLSRLTNKWSEKAGTRTQIEKSVNSSSNCAASLIIAV